MGKDTDLPQDKATLAAEKAEKKRLRISRSNDPTPIDKNIRRVGRALRLVVLGTVVLLIAIGMAPFHEYYIAQGVVVPSDYRDLYAPTDCLVESCEVRADDHVEKGQVLMRFRMPLLEEEIQRTEEELANYEAAHEAKLARIEVTKRLPLPKELWEIRAQVEKSQKEVEFYKKQYERQLELSAEGVASKQDVERTKLQYDQAKIEKKRLEERFQLIEEGYTESLLEQGQAEAREMATRVKGMKRRLQLLREKMERLSVLKAPGQGSILELPFRHEGQMVHQGDLLVYMSLGDKRKVRISGAERNLYKVRVGQKVQYNPELYDTMLFRQAHGWVKRISEVRRSESGLGGADPADSSQGSYLIYADIQREPIPLKIGSQVTARVILERKPIWRLLLGMDQ